MASLGITLAKTSTKSRSRRTRLVATGVAASSAGARDAVLVKQDWCKARRIEVWDQQQAFVRTIFNNPGEEWKPYRQRH